MDKIEIVDRQRDRDRGGVGSFRISDAMNRLVCEVKLVPRAGREEKYKEK